MTNCLDPLVIAEARKTAQNRRIGERGEPTWPSVGLGRQRAGSEALPKLGRDAPEVIDAHVHVLSDGRETAGCL